MHILLQHTNNAPPTAAATALRGIFDQATAAKAHTTVECVLGKLEYPEWVNHCIPMASWPGLGT